MAAKNGVIGVGVIGLGIMGQLHARIYQEMQDTQLVGVMDSDVAKCKTVANELGTKAFCTLDEMLSDPSIKAISVATPDHVHYQIVMACLQAQKHVLVEKPLATNLEEARKMVEMAKKTGCILMVNYNNRWGLLYQITKKLIDDGKIGEIMCAYARKYNNITVPTRMLKWASYTSCVHFLATHDIDMVLWFLNYPKPIEVYAIGCEKVLRQQGIHGPDLVHAMVRFDNGAFATFECGWIYPPSYPTPTEAYMHIIGAKGVIHIERREENIFVSTYEGVQFPRTCLGGEVDGRYQGALRSALEHFIRAVKSGHQPETCGERALIAVEIATAIHRSLEDKRPVSLPV